MKICQVFLLTIGILNGYNNWTDFYIAVQLKIEEIKKKKIEWI